MASIAVITGNLDLVSADLPGATSNYIEDSLGNNAVAVYSNGAAGDQNPIFFQQTYDLRAIRIARLCQARRGYQQRDASGRNRHGSEEPRKSPS